MMSLDAAVKAVIDECPNIYAITYASKMGEARRMYGREGEKAQILYILSNMDEWEGQRADEVRKALEHHAK